VETCLFVVVTDPLERAVPLMLSLAPALDSLLAVL
jgi:hypothetical protein